MATDLTSYLQDVYNNNYNSKKAQIDSAYNQDIATYDAQASALPGEYQAAKNQVAATNEKNARAFNEQATAAGMNSGAYGQAALSRSNAYIGNIAKLDKAQNAALNDINLAKANRQTQYQNELLSAQNDRDTELSTALYNEYVRQEEAAVAAQQYADQLALQQRELDMKQQELDAKLAASSSSSSGSGSGSGSGTGVGTVSVDTPTVKSVKQDLIDKCGTNNYASQLAMLKENWDYLIDNGMTYDELVSIQNELNANRYSIDEYTSSVKSNSTHSNSTPSKVNDNVKQSTLDLAKNTSTLVGQLKNTSILSKRVELINAAKSTGLIDDSTANTLTNTYVTKPQNEKKQTNADNIKKSIFASYGNKTF